MMAALRIESMHHPAFTPPPTATFTKPTVAFTTPRHYADSLSHLLTLKYHTPLWCPTITTELTPETITHYLSPDSFPLFSAVALPSRAAISSFSLAAHSLTKPLLPPNCNPLIISALGKDAELIDESFMLDICSNLDRIRLLAPKIATPAGLVQSLEAGHGRRILCLVPLVVGLVEPPVVPDFLKDLEVAGWVPVRVNAYETRWAGAMCAERVVSSKRVVDAMVFTSSAEVEGLLKSLKELNWDWKMVKKRWPNLVVAAHGPVTAAGAERLGVSVDVVSSRFDTFDGVVEALDSRLRLC